MSTIKSGTVEMSKITMNTCKATSTTNGVGGAICSEISGGKLTIKESSSFTGCTSGTTSGAMHAVISGGEIEINKITFNGCIAKSGGAIYSTISLSGKLTITNQCSFSGC
jgi:predicted outer membrane repeat protein